MGNESYTKIELLKISGEGQPVSLTWLFKKNVDLVVAVLSRNPGLEWTKIENLLSPPWRNSKTVSVSIIDA